MLATVLPDLCASCGICAGACPSSTPFRSSEHIVSGIDLPHQPIDRLRDELDRSLAALTGAARIVVFGCRHGARVDTVSSADTAAMSVECAGMLAPSFVEYAIRAGAQGILVTGCGPGDCEYRLGTLWTEERIAGVREPHLRANVARAKVHISWRGAGEEGALQNDLRAFRASLRSEAHADAPHRRSREARTHG